MPAVGLMQSCQASCWLTFAWIKHVWVWRGTGKSSGFASQQLLHAQITQQAPFGSTLLSTPRSFWLGISDCMCGCQRGGCFPDKKWSRGIWMREISERCFMELPFSLLTYPGVLCPFTRSGWPQDPNLSLLSWGHFLVWLLNMGPGDITVGCQLHTVSALG